MNITEIQRLRTILQLEEQDLARFIRESADPKSIQTTARNIEWLKFQLGLFPGDVP